MLITDLPELEDTDFYRLVKEKGRLEGAVEMLVSFGRQYWGAEPQDISNLLNALTKKELNALTEQMPKLAGWDGLRELILAKSGSK